MSSPPLPETGFIRLADHQFNRARRKDFNAEARRHHDYDAAEETLPKFIVGE
jgi:hypothetical protein